MDRTARNRLALRAAESALWDAYVAVRALGRSALPVRESDVLHAEGHVLRALELLGDIYDDEEGTDGRD